MITGLCGLSDIRLSIDVRFIWLLGGLLAYHSRRGQAGTAGSHLVYSANKNKHKVLSEGKEGIEN